MQWYYAENQRSVGPVEEEVFLSWVRAGRIKPDMLVWHEGMPQWTRYADLKPPEPPGPGSPPVKIASGVCARCHRSFRHDEMVNFQGSTICAECKPAFFQAVQEGVDSSVTGGVGATPNAELMAIARSRLEGRWGSAIGITLLFWLISFAIQMIPYVNGLIQLFLIPPFTLGLTGFFIALGRNQSASVGMLGDGFNRYWVSVGSSFFMGLITSGALLVAAIPAIGLGVYAASQESVAMVPWVVALSLPAIFLSIYLGLMFALPFYIIADAPSVGVFESLGHSYNIMKGMKWKLFCLQWRFVGWGLLALLTLGIGFLWLSPYMSTALALFYDDVRGRLQEQTG